MLIALLTLLLLNLLLIAHELGHFLLAKLFNVKVIEFGVGFPPKILSFKKGEVTYALNSIPLGAYVNLVEEENNPDPRNFRNKSFWQKILILSGGVLANTLIAIIIFVVLFNIGIPRNILPDNYHLSVLNSTNIIRLNFIQSLKETFAFLFFVFKETLRGLKIAFIKIFTSLDVSDLTGPVGIFTITNRGFYHGLIWGLYVLGLISYALAIFNFLPIPVVDGGKIIVVFIEKIFKKQLNPKVINAIDNVALIFLLFLAILVTIKDIRFFYFS
ncbi:MAG: site-2 protease family protein [Minisyncoccia bacterium]